MLGFVACEVERICFVLLVLLKPFGFLLSNPGFFAEVLFVTSSGALVCRVWPFASVCCCLPVCRVIRANTFVVPALLAVATVAIVSGTRVVRAGLMSGLLLMIATFAGLILGVSLCNRADKSVLLVLLCKEKLLLT